MAIWRIFFPFFFLLLMHHSHVPVHKSVLNIISTFHIPEISVFPSKISSVIQSISDSQSGFDCTVIASHFGFFDYIVVDSGLLFAVLLCKTHIHNIASKDLKKMNNDFRVFWQKIRQMKACFEIIQVISNLKYFDFWISSCFFLKKSIFFWSCQQAKRKPSLKFWPIRFMLIW